jgi:hypothetical protein
MKRVIARWMLCTLMVGILQASAQTTKSTLIKNGFVSGEHAVFKFNGGVLAIRYGSERSGLGITTDWYTYVNGVWKPASGALHSSNLPAVRLGECDRDDTLNISNRFPTFNRLLPPGSTLKYVGSNRDSEDSSLVISSRPAPNTQTGSILQISWIRGSPVPELLASVDMGEDRYCRAQWNAHIDGTRDLVVFTLQPAGSSVSYAFQSFSIRKQ